MTYATCKEILLAYTERLTKRTTTYYSKFLHVRQVRNMSLWRTYVCEVLNLSHPALTFCKG